MRKHFYLVMDSPKEDRIGGVDVVNQRYATGEKNVETHLHKRNYEKDESFTEKIVSLGYHDFDGEQDYQENAVEVMRQKLGEIDESHLENVGLDPEEVTA